VARARARRVIGVFNSRLLKKIALGAGKRFEQKSE
jgi:hypothetical protein